MDECRFSELCPECYSHLVIEDPARGDMICSNCGLILESNLIDLNPEWRAFDSLERMKKCRIGTPIYLSLHDKGLSTIIDWRDCDAFGKKLSPFTRAQAHRLRKWQIRMRFHSSIDRNLAFAMSELDRLCSQLSIQKSLKEQAAIIYRQAIIKHLIRGRSIEAMITAAIYTACRLANCPRTLDELVINSRINRRDLGRCYRIILRELNFKIPITSPNRFIARFATDLNVSQQSQINALQILNYAQRRGLTVGKDPCGLAAASIYVAALHNGERKTQREIAKVASVTEVTVRTRYKELVKCLNLVHSSINS